jgi:hypothetical protein
VSVGDICLIEDASSYNATFTYLVTVISGSNYTLRYITDDGDNGSASPCDLFDMGFSQASALFKRAYSTIALWGADLDNTDYYSSGDDAVGECHADSVFTVDAVMINLGGTVGLNSRTLTAHVDSRHDGTKGSGVVLKHGVYTSLQMIKVWITDTTLSWLEFDGQDGSVQTQKVIEGNNAPNFLIQNCLFYDFSGDSSLGHAAHIIRAIGCCPIITSCFLWNISSAAPNDYFHIFSSWSTGSGGMKIYNTTVYGIDLTTDDSYIFYNVWADDATEIRNLILMDWDAEGGLSNVSPHASAVLDYWGLEATDSDVSNEIIDTVANTFVDSTIGDPDLHLKDGSLFVDRGVDLGTSPTNVNIDIDGRDRDSEGDTWDMGADESLHSITALPGSTTKRRTRLDSLGMASGLDGSD